MDANRIALIDILMVVLSLLSVFLLFFEVISSISPTQIKIIGYVDLSIAFIFLLEFCYKLLKSNNRIRFVRRYWWELLAAVPITSYTTQALRILKVIRIFPFIESLRLVRFIARFRLILLLSKKYTKQTALLYVMAIVGAIIIVGAAGFYKYEHGVNPRVRTFGDSVYWATITTATVGYGDIFPVTSGGRIIAVMLIFSGLGTLGAFISIIESYIIGHAKFNRG